MSLETPTTQQINENIIAQLEASLNQTIPLLPKSFLRVLAKVLSGVFVIIYKYGGFIFKQMFVQTASFKDVDFNGTTINPLKFWGRLIGVGDPVEATRSELEIEITVLDQTGNLSSGTQLVGETNGVTYILTSGVVLNSEKVQGIIKAVNDQSGGNGSGIIGNLEPDQLVSFVSPLPNIDRIAKVTKQEVTGTEGETEAFYRQRIIDRFQKKPQGGAYADYEQWGEEAAGIIKVYPYTGQPGQVDVYSEATIDSSGNPDGIPTQAQLQDVLDLINYDQNGLASRRNANAWVNSLPITRTAFDALIVGIAGVSDLAETRNSITAALKEYFLSVEPFISGLSLLPRNDRITRTRVSSIVEDIVTASGGTFISVSFKVKDTVSSLDAYSMGKGEKAKISSVDFL